MGKFLVYDFRYSTTIRRLLRAFVSGTLLQHKQGCPETVCYHKN